MKACLLLLVVFSLVLCQLTLAQGELKLPSILGDHMVFQQGMPIVVWGWGKPGEEVKVSLDGMERKGKVYADGKWMVKLPARPAGGPYEVKITSGEDEITLKDVLIGEVWVCSGQSNMEWPVAASNNAQEEISRANYPQIRLFTVPHATSLVPQENCGGRWEVCSPNTVGGFSAVAYFFGREIHEKLKVPIGLIHTSWGGTPAESWTDLETLRSDPDLTPLLERIPKESTNLNPWIPTALYNAMIHPLLPFRIRGAIWYQGESNADRAYQYRKLFPVMIEGWRRNWKEGDFPFLFVQLANFMARQPEPTESAWAELREAQLLTLKTVPNTGMAVAIDIGDANDIHPRNKQDVGKRLALWALALTYGQKVEYSGPIYREMRIEGDKIRIFFDHADGGLVAKGGELKGFAIAGADRKFHWARARIEGDTVVVWSEEVPQPVAVRYAWADNPDCNLYNKAGLPAPPFRTDDWRRGP